MAKQVECVLRFKASDDWMDDERPAVTVYSSGQWDDVGWEMQSGIDLEPYCNVQMHAKRDGMSYIWMDMRFEKEAQFDLVLAALESARREWKEQHDAWLAARTAR